MVSVIVNETSRTDRLSDTRHHDRDNSDWPGTHRRDEVLTSLKNPRVVDTVKLRERRGRDKAGQFLIEGYRELRRAVDASLPIDELFICPEQYLGVNEPALVADAARLSGARITEVSAPVFTKLAYRERPEGLLAVAPVPSWTLSSLTPVPAGRAPLYVVAVGIEKPGNLGTMLRTADAVGADAVIVCDRCTDIFNPNVVRASTGTLFTVPVAEASTVELLGWLQLNAIAAVATTPDTNTMHYDADLTGPCAVIVGTEQLGLPSEWLAACDVRVRIPMAGTADSLNAAIATAVVLYEAIRQRSTRGS
jgi:RNA methyltransferase, TrmH family